MNSKSIREYKKTLKLSKKQRSIITGLLLGDGHLETQNGGKTWRLKVEHGESQKAYTEWLFNELKDWVNAKSIYKKVSKNGRISYGFTTYSHGSLRFYGQQFYRNGKKIIPKMINKMLEPLSIAIWYLDDGSKKSKRHKTYIIHTLGFSKKDLERMRGVLKKKFDISASLHSQKRKYWRIYIPAESASNFKNLVGFYIQKIPSMKYKL